MVLLFSLLSVFLVSHSSPSAVVRLCLATSPSLLLSISFFPWINDSLSDVLSLLDYCDHRDVRIAFHDPIDSHDVGRSNQRHLTSHCLHSPRAYPILRYPILSPPLLYFSISFLVFLASQIPNNFFKLRSSNPSLG